MHGFYHSFFSTQFPPPSGPFLSTFQIIKSKQRPRKITIRGDDGRDYVFLLKGHEDLRQDERVMQLFGQVCMHKSADDTIHMYFVWRGYVCLGR